MICTTKLKGEVDKRLPSLLFSPLIYSPEIKESIFIEMHSDAFTKAAGKHITESPELDVSTDGIAYVRSKDYGRLPIHPQEHFMSHPEVSEFFYPETAVSAKKELKAFTKSAKMRKLEKQLGIKLNSVDELDNLILHALDATKASIEVNADSLLNATAHKISLGLNRIADIVTAEKGKASDVIKKVVLHELVHANTLAMFDLAKRGDKAAQNAVAPIIELWSQFKERQAKEPLSLVEVDMQSLQLDPAEFLAVAISDKALQDYMNKADETWVQRILNAIKSLFGLGTTKPSEQLLRSFKQLQELNANTTLDADLGTEKYGYGKGVEEYYANENKRVAEIMKNILSRSDKVITQYADGKELDHYIIDAVKYMRLTTPSGFINKLVHRKSMELEDVIKHLIAREWKGSKSTDALPVGEAGERLTQEQFAEYVRSNVLRSQTRGRIIHMLIEEAIAAKAGLTLDPGAKARLVEEKAMYKKLEKVKAKHMFSWVAQAVDSYLEASDINLNVADQIHGVKIATEVGVYSELLNFASRIDMLTVRNFDGKFGIVDTKTGHDVLDSKFKQLFNEYAYQTHYIHNTARDRAKLEIMFRAIALKLENPDMQFYMLKIGNFQNEEFAARRAYIDYVEVDDYIGMIKDMFNDKTFTDAVGLTKPGDSETLYTKMLKKSPKLFTPSEYFDNRLVSAELKEATTVSAEEGLKSSLMELTDMVANQVLHGRKGWQDKIAEKTKEVLMTYRDVEDNWEIEYSDIGILKGWLGNFEDWELPAARAYGRMYHARLQQYEVDAARFRAKLVKASENVLKEYKARNSKYGIKYLENIKYYVGDGRGLYDFAYVVTHIDGRDVTRLRNPQDDPTYFKEGGPLSKAEREYLTLVNQAMGEAGEYLHEERYTIPTKGKGEAKTITKSSIDLWNDTQKFLDFPKKRQIKQGFFWKFPKTDEEMRNDNFHKGGAFYMMKRSLASIPMSWTWHMEDTYDADKVNQAMIPIKGLGSAANDAAGNFTYDLTFSTLQGHNNYLRKKHMDDVAVVGAGLQHYLSSIETDTNTMSTYKSIMDATTVKKVLGINKQVKFNSSPIRINFRDHKGELHQSDISLDKLIKGAVRFTNTAIMPLRFFQPIGTGVQALLSLGRDVSANSILKKMNKTMATEYENYNLSAFHTAIGDVFKTGYDELVGDITKNKAAVMVKEFGYLPKAYSAFVERDKLATTNYSALTQSNMYFTQMLTEDPITYLTLVTQMKSIMHNGKSLWDWYEVKDGELVWTGGTRYMERTADGLLVPVTGISSKELTKLKYVYEKVQGGYSASALAPIEAFYWGQALMALKRWLPRVMLNMLHDTRRSFSLGAYIVEPGADNQIEYFVNPETKERIPIAEWKAQMSEGKITTALRLILSLPVLYGGKAFTGRPLNLLQLSKLKPYEKQNLIELLLAIITLIGMFAASAMIWDDDDDEDMPEDQYSMERKWFKRYLIENLAQQYNPAYLADNVIRMGEIMALKRTYDFAMYGSKFFYSVVSHDVTRDGNYRYRKQFIKHLPYIGPIATTITSLGQSEVYEDKSTD